MNASPIQRYALRLLIATKKIEPLEPREWRILQADSADSYLAPFGGISSAILGIDLKQKTASDDGKNSSSPFLSPLGRHHQTQKSKIELE